MRPVSRGEGLAADRHESVDDDQGPLTNCGSEAAVRNGILVVDHSPWGPGGGSA